MPSDRFSNRNHFLKHEIFHSTICLAKSHEADQKSLQLLVKKLIKRYHSINAANKCHSDLTDVLHGHIRLLKRCFELLKTDNKLLKERVDLLNTDATTTDFSNIDTTSGLLPASHSKLDDNSYQVPPTAEPEKNQFDA